MRALRRGTSRALDEPQAAPLHAAGEQRGAAVVRPVVGDVAGADGHGHAELAQERALLAGGGIGDVWELCTRVGMAGRLEESDLRLPAVRALDAASARNATGAPPRGDECVCRLDAVHDVRRR